MKILYLRKFDKYCKYWLLPQIRTQLYMGPADPKAPQTFHHLFSSGSKAIKGQQFEDILDDEDSMYCASVTVVQKNEPKPTDLHLLASVIDKYLRKLNR